MFNIRVIVEDACNSALLRSRIVRHDLILVNIVRLYSDVLKHLYSQLPQYEF